MYSLFPTYNTEVRAELGAQGINSPSAAKCNQTPGVSTLKSSWICVGYRSEHITSFDRWLYFSFQRGRGEGKESQGTHAQQSFEYGPRKAGWGIFLSSGHTLRRTEIGGVRPLELGACWLRHWKMPSSQMASPSYSATNPSINLPGILERVPGGRHLSGMTVSQKASATGRMSPISEDGSITKIWNTTSRSDSTETPTYHEESG